MLISFGSAQSRLSAASSLLISVSSQMLYWASPVEAQSFLEQLFGSSPAPQVRAAPRLAPPQSLTGNAPVRIRLSPSAFSSERLIRSTAPPEGSGSYTTVCVRTCDGFYFPISHQAPRGRFYHDAEQCRARCSSSDAQLFYYPSSGGNMKTAVDLTGRSYARLPFAFQHRKKLVSGCACRPEPWSVASLVRHEKYALAEGLTPSGHSRPISQIQIIAGAYTDAPSRGPDAPSGAAAEMQADAAPKTVNAMSSAAGGRQENPESEVEASTDEQRAEAGRAAARPASMAIRKRTTGRSGGKAGTVAANGTAARKPTRMASVSTSSNGGSKLVWPGDPPVRAR